MEALEALENWKDDASAVDKGTAAAIFSGIPMLRDEVFISLVKESSTANQTKELVQRIF